MLSRRVVVTGLGLVTPLGNDLETSWQGLREGKSGISAITNFDASTFKTQIAGEVKNFPFDDIKNKNPELVNAGRATLFAVQASLEAYKDARFCEAEINRGRFGIYFGAGDNGIPFETFVASILASLSEGSDELVDKTKYVEAALKNLNPQKELECQPFMTLSHLVRIFKIEGAATNCLTACAASSQAIGEAFEQIKRGDADIMLTGGSHSMIYPMGVSGFSLLTALSTRNNEPRKASRPFDKNRDGFVLAEGAGALILEELEHAKARGAKILGEVVGYGTTADAYRMTDMDPEGKGATLAVKNAMAKAGLEAGDIDYINAHGTSTSVNDSLETKVIKNVFGEYAKKIPISSIKSSLGHMIAAAGAVDAIACLLAMRDSIIPPTINYETPDPVCDLDYVPNAARKADVKIALSNSFGFGGQNICLALRRYDE